MYRVMNDCAGSNIRDALMKRNLAQTNCNLSNSYTDLALTNPKREFQKKDLNMAKLTGGIIFSFLHTHPNSGA